MNTQQRIAHAQFAAHCTYRYKLRRNISAYAAYLELQPFLKETLPFWQGYAHLDDEELVDRIIATLANIQQANNVASEARE